MGVLRLKSGSEKSLLRRHPWVFSGAVASVLGNPKSGDTVEVVSAEGQFLGRGAYSPASQIRIRIWTFDEADIVDESFIDRRIKTSISLRKSRGFSENTTGFRLISSESVI